jgi:capsular polysaccharide biosynthesis protein
MYGDLPLGLFLLPNGVVRGEAGYIYTSDGDPIIEQNADFLRKKRFLRPRFELSEQAENRAPVLAVDELVSLKMRCSNGFFHWMTGSLPKVFLAEEVGFRGHYLLPRRAIAPWAYESMKLLGISEARLLCDEQRDLHAARLYVPTYFSGYNAHHNVPFMRLYRDWIRAAVPESLQGVAERVRLFVGRRSGVGVRRVLNHHEVEERLAAFGFSTVYFEDLSLGRQLQLACAADIIVGPHGAGLSHTLFMEDRSVVIELFPHKRQQSCDCFETLATIAQHRYFALESAIPCEGDITVDVQELGRVLSQFV